MHLFSALFTMTYDVSRRDMKKHCFTSKWLLTLNDGPCSIQDQLSCYQFMKMNFTVNEYMVGCDNPCKHYIALSGTMQLAGHSITDVLVDQ